jgi:chromosome segregation ATPase
MENWKEYGYPFQDFNQERSQTWINNGLTQAEAEEWLDSGIAGNDCYSIYFIAWLRDEKKLTISDWKEASISERNDLLEQFQKHLNLRKKKDIFGRCADNCEHYCDHCWGRVEKKSMFFSDRKQNLDFCSENCQTKWKENKKAEETNFLEIKGKERKIEKLIENEERIKKLESRKESMGQEITKLEARINVNKRLFEIRKNYKWSQNLEQYLNEEISKYQTELKEKLEKAEDKKKKLQWLFELKKHMLNADNSKLESKSDTTIELAATKKFIEERDKNNHELENKQKKVIEQDINLRSEECNF